MLAFSALWIGGAALCGSAEPEPPVTPVVRTGEGAVKLRMVRPVNKSMIYEGTLDREQRGKNSYHSVDTFYLNSLCASREEGRDLLAMLRTHLKRTRQEKYENSKPLETAPLNSTDLIDLGPNFNTVGTLRCYAYDSQNRLAYKTMQLLTLKDGSQFHGNVARRDDKKLTFISDDEKDNMVVGSMELPLEKVLRVEPIPLPHVCINEAPHYMFPIFPERAVSTGDTWRFRVPIIIPLELGLQAKIAPTQFDAIFNGKLRDLRETPAGRVATVDYSIDGAFDSSLPEFKSRFTEEFQNGSRITHKFTGTGWATIDVERGWMLERHENFTFNFYGLTQLPPEQKFDKNGKLVSEKPRKPSESKADITSRFDLKLLMPGTRLRSGAVVPAYE